MLFKACVFKNVLLASRKEHITTMHFSKWLRFIFRLFSTTRGTLKKNLSLGCILGFFGEAVCAPGPI